jgi:hypothetical protein
MIPDSSDRRELARTSSPSACTTPGTSADLATLYAFDSTSTENASGNSSRLSRWLIISTQMAARPALAPTTTQRRPPRTRSSHGPINGATTENGAIVSAR